MRIEKKNEKQVRTKEKTGKDALWEIFFENFDPTLHRNGLRAIWKTFKIPYVLKES